MGKRAKLGPCLRVSLPIQAAHREFSSRRCLAIQALVRSVEQFGRMNDRLKAVTESPWTNSEACKNNSEDVRFLSCLENSF